MKAKIKKSFLRDNFLSFLPALLFVLVAAIIIISTASVSKNSEKEALEIAAESIRRSVITCYAQEGSYPPSIDYLKENYGLHISDSYTVYYDIFASNIMPEITVLAN